MQKILPTRPCQSPAKEKLDAECLQLMLRILVVDDAEHDLSQLLMDKVILESLVV